MLLWPKFVLSLAPLDAASEWHAMQPSKAKGPKPKLMTPSSPQTCGGLSQRRDWPLQRPDASADETCRKYSDPVDILKRRQKGRWRRQDIKEFAELDPPNLMTDVQALIGPSAVAAAADASFVMFMARGRSGHSLVGSLIDAHPHAIVSNELEVFKLYKDHVGKGEQVDRDMLLGKMVNNSVACGLHGRYQSGYLYSVPGAWTGQWSCRIDTIGDKRGSELRSLVRETSDDNVKKLANMIEVLQTPAYKIVTVSSSCDGKNMDNNALEIQRRLRPYLRNGTRVETFDVVDFACNPREKLEALCDFLGLERDEKYLGAATALVDVSYCRQTGARHGRACDGSENVQLLG